MNDSPTQDEESRVPEPIDPADLTLEMFKPWIGKDFTIHTGPSETLTLQLLDAVPSPYEGIRKGGGFSLLFAGPADDYFLQKTLLIGFPDGSCCNLLIVCNGPIEGTMRYSIILA